MSVGQPASTRAANGRRGQRLLLALAILAWTVVNVWWFVVRRVGQPLNIDEAGYLAMAVNDLLGLRRGGPGTWLEAVLWPGVHSPLTPGAASLVFAILGPRSEFGVAVILLSSVGVLVTTAALAARLGRRPAVVWLSLLFVAAAPNFLAYSRQFVFAVPATLVTTGALYALVRSRGLAGLPWSITFGALVGLMPLTRTMTLALVPGLVVAALAQALVPPDGGDSRGRRVAYGVAAAVVGGAVAAVWLVPSWGLVLDYLTAYGYGAQSASYANTAESRLGGLVVALTNEFYLPLVLVLAAGWALALAYALRFVRSDPEPGVRTARLRSAIRSPLFPCIAVVLTGGVALASTRNAGSGFALPLLPAAAVVAAWGFAGFVAGRRRQWQRVAVIAVVVALPAATFAAATFHQSWFSVPRYVSAPGLGRMIVTEGRDLDPAYYLASRVRTENAPGFGDDWARVNAALLDGLLDAATTRPDFAMGFRGYFVNSNTLQLGVMAERDETVPAMQIDPVVLDGEADYRSWLADGAAATACHLLTSAGTTNEFAPFVDTAALERAGTEAGFTLEMEVSTPDNRTVSLWEREGC